MASGGVLGCRWEAGDEWSRGGRDNGETGYGQSLNKQARERGERRQADATNPTLTVLLGHTYGVTVGAAGLAGLGCFSCLPVCPSIWALWQSGSGSLQWLSPFSGGRAGFKIRYGS
ncbi:hypothetical protein I7I51_00566 [Histoplasma capsulatum]|uniref:Uncharacterized protein n=1 Tax=Ajellomyces capsulatus TaxID=5037 RepID=A0A8A1MAD0_AJECA|nr:hypothetical protein I7I51_00566 [Histoplasma capsulatum]